jgi:hypothetical protein
MKSILWALPALLALAACDRGTQGADATAEEAAAKGDLAANSSVAPTSSASTGAEITQIPAAIRGRWGLVPADCEPGRDDAKGLLTITADNLEFYESVGTLSGIREAAEDRIRASFDFVGEGMEWKRDMSLEAQDGGSTLVRREFGPEAAPEPLRYAKCE